MATRKFQQTDKMALNFDLFQNKLKAHGFENPVKAYVELGNSLKKLGFEKRQQSSWISKEPENITSIYRKLRTIKTNHLWFSDCVNKITATAESAILDLNPLIHDSMNEKEFLNFENEKGIAKEARAIHFDLGIKEIDKNYDYRSKPYLEINKAMKEIGFHHQQGSGYISNYELTPDEFIYAIQSLKEKVPKLQNVVKHIDATYLKDQWDMTPFVKDNLKDTKNQPNFIYQKELKTSTQEKSDNIILLLNKKVRYNEIEPKLLIGLNFSKDEQQYQILDLELLPGQTKDVATLKRISDGQVFQDKDFASTKPFKLNLQSPMQFKDLISTKSQEKILAK